MRPRRPPRCPRPRFRHRLRPKPLRSSPPNRVVSRRLPLTTGNRRQKTAEAIPRSFFCIVHFLYTFPVFSASTACSPRSRCSRCSPHFLRSYPFSAPSAHPHPPLLLPLVFSSVPVCPCLLPPSFPALPLQPVLLVPHNLFMCDLSFFCYLRLPSYYCILFEPLPGASSSWGCPLFASSPRSTLLPPPSSVIASES